MAKEETSAEFDPVIELAKNWGAAFSRHRRDLVREAIDSSGFNALEFEDFLLAVAEEGDRSLAILVVGYLDNVLERFITQEIAEDFQGILRPREMLGNLDSRLRFTAALNWVDKGTYNDASLLRKIRNRFAHHIDCSSFEDQKVADWIRLLLPTEIEFYEVKRVDKLVDQKTLTLRALFLVRATRVLTDITIQMLSAPSFIRHGFHPSMVFADGGRRIPVVVKDIMHVSIDFNYLILAHNKEDAKKNLREFRHKIEIDDTERHSGFEDVLANSIEPASDD